MHHAEVAVKLNKKIVIKTDLPTRTILGHVSRNTHLTFWPYGVLQDSGAHIKVFTQCCPQSTERVIQISGQKENIVKCIGLIMEDLAEVCLWLVCVICIDMNMLISIVFWPRVAVLFS